MNPWPISKIIEKVKNIKMTNNAYASKAMKILKNKKINNELKLDTMSLISDKDAKNGEMNKLESKKMSLKSDINLKAKNKNINIRRPTFFQNAMKKHKKKIKSRCLELKHNSRKMYRPFSHKKIAQEMFNEMSHLLNINLSPIIQPSLHVLNQCIFINQSESHQHFLRIGAEKLNINISTNPHLIITSKPINHKLFLPNISCLELCKIIKDCKCVQPEIKKNNKLIYIIPNIESGNKYLTSIDHNVGIQTFSMFDQKYDGNKSNNNILSHFNLGKNQNINVLFHNLKNHEIRLKFKPNQILNEKNMILMKAIPLIGKNMPEMHKKCEINHNQNECSMFVDDINIDWNIRLNNIGNGMSDVQLFAVENPSKFDDSSNNSIILNFGHAIIPILVVSLFMIILCYIYKKIKTKMDQNRSNEAQKYLLECSLNDVEQITVENTNVR